MVTDLGTFKGKDASYHKFPARWTCTKSADLSGHCAMAAAARVDRSVLVLPFSFGYFSFGQAKEK